MAPHMMAQLFFLLLPTITRSFTSLPTSPLLSRRAPVPVVLRSTTTEAPPTPTAEQVAAQQQDDYAKGLVTISGITLIFASNSPAIHACFAAGSESAAAPPVLLLNCATSLAALLGLVVGGPILDGATDRPKTLTTTSRQRDALLAGAELGTWKFLAVLANIFGLSLTSAGHGAFLIQMTTLLVPLAQRLQGVPIPPRIWGAIGLALSGVALFTADPNSAAFADPRGDLLCVLAACFYATYDLRLFKWGSIVPPLDLITNKIAVQAGLSSAALLASGLLGSGGSSGSSSSNALADSITYVQSLQEGGESSFLLVALVVIWSGVVVNGVASFLQVGGQQAIGPARAQVIYASQPLWAAIMSFLLLHETVGPEGVVGGGLFLAAMFIAATAGPPDPECGVEVCEV